MALIWAKDIEDETKDNTNFRTVLWTGEHSQLTVMSIKPGEEIGLEVHHDIDQFLRVEQGKARVEAGLTEDNLTEQHDIKDDWAIIVPAGTWHNVINTGDEELKLYSIYSPSNHPAGAIHVTKAEADAAEAAEHLD
jgi:mannose-6-phosphate isomerase-like protein (cupin superfamily)